MPTLYNWNLALEHQLPSNILVRGAYVASRSTHLTETLNLNPSPVRGGTLRLNAIAGGPVFSTVQQDLQDINATYHSLQLSAERRATHGLTVFANYTWSKLSSKGNFGALQQAGDPRIGQLAVKLFF